MFDDFMLEMMPDIIDCMMEFQKDFNRAKNMKDSDLVDKVTEMSYYAKIENVIDPILKEYFKSEYISEENRIKLQYCYALVICKYVIDSSGEIYATQILHKS